MEQDMKMPEVISIYDGEADQTLQFADLCRLQNEDGAFAALMYLGDDLPEDACPLVIVRVVEEENGEAGLRLIKDDDLLAKLAPIFETRLEELYGEHFKK